MERDRTLVEILASTVQAWRNCTETNNTEWEDRHRDRIKQLVSLLPSGSGIDCGTEINLDKCHAEKIVLYTSFHHMNDAGFYDGWTEHTIVVTPSFRGINLRISGRDRNQIKDYLVETYDYALTRPIDWDEENQRYIIAR